MARNRKNDLEKMERVESGWRQNAADDQLADMTPAEYSTQIDKSRELRRAVDDAESLLVDLNKRLDLVDAANIELTDLVVNSVRASRKYGPDSPLIGSMGFVRKSDRKTGKTNRKRSTDK